MKKIMFIISAALISSAIALSVSAESPLTLSNATVDASATEGVSTVSFDCDSTVSTEQLSIMLTSEVLSEDIAFDKIVHIDQVDVSDDGTYTFSILDSRVPANATELYLNVGGMGIDEPQACVIKLMSTVLGDCDGDGDVTTDDLVMLRKYIAGLISEINEDNANVDTSSAGITTDDLVMLRKVIAGLITLG